MKKVCNGYDIDGNKLDGCRFIRKEDGIEICGPLKKPIKENEQLKECPVQNITKVSI